MLLILTVLVSIYGITVSADETNLQVNSESFNGTKTLEPTRAEQDMQMLVNLLGYLGIDISYGEDGGTIFSMVDASLTEIISSLSSGQVEGFMDIPLIRETLDYFGYSSEEIVMSPDSSSGMEATLTYNQKYGNKPTSSEE